MTTHSIEIPRPVLEVDVRTTYDDSDWNATYTVTVVCGGVVLHTSVLNDNEHGLSDEEGAIEVALEQFGEKLARLLSD